MKCEKKYKCVCKNCGKEFYAVSKRVKYCSDECKLEGIHSLKVPCICEVCGKEYLGYPKSKKVKHSFCSSKCRAKFKNTKTQNSIIEKRNNEASGVEGYDYVSCRICGCKMTQLTHHLKRYHDMSVDDYLSKYPDAKITAQGFVDDHLVGDKNPMSHQNRTDEEIRKSSPFCKEFYDARGGDEFDRVRFFKYANRNKTKESYCTNIEYYVSRGYSIDEAIKIRRKMHGMSIENFIERYGEEEGTRRFVERQKKWKASVFATSRCNTSSSVSNISRQFIRDVLGDDLYESSEFLHDKTEFEIDGENGHIYFYDLTNPRNKRIIEFNGDLWHGNPSIYTEDEVNRINGEFFKDIWKRDKEKLETARKNGFEVLVVWESEYKTSKDTIVAKSKQFLFE